MKQNIIDFFIGCFALFLNCSPIIGAIILLIIVGRSCYQEEIKSQKLNNMCEVQCKKDGLILSHRKGNNCYCYPDPYTVKIIK